MFEPKKRRYEMYTYFGEENGWKVKERKIQNVQEEFLGCFFGKDSSYSESVIFTDL